MFTLKVENIKNEILTLTQNESDFQVVSVSGLNPPNAQINRANVAGVDGTRYNSSKLTERNIVITLKLNGHVEENRLSLYKYFPTKEWCKIYYKNGNRDVFIEGYIETNEVDLFSNSELMQISIICPYPYFKSLDMIVNDISKSSGAFKFPFSINVNAPIPFSTIDSLRITNIENDSETTSGLIIEATFLGSVSKLEIKNTTTNESLVINYNFLANDLLKINTNKGEKSIKLVRNATEYNLISAMTRTSSFFQLQMGDNLFSYLADNGASDQSVTIIFKHYTVYRGV